MNKYMLFVPTILILIGIGVASPAFAVTTITMQTDNQIYDHTSTIILTGNVDPVDLQGSEVTIVCKSPGGAGVCGIFQIKPDSNGDFSVLINTATSLMKKDGIYQFEAQYSSLADTTVSVELVDAIETPDSYSSEPLGSEMGTAVTGIAEQSAEFYRLSPGQIQYDMTCDADPGFFANADDDSIVIYLDPLTDGVITLTLHEE